MVAISSVWWASMFLASWIASGFLPVAGVVAIVFSLIVHQQRTRSTHVVDERGETLPLRYGPARGALGAPAGATPGPRHQERMDGSATTSEVAGRVESRSPVDVFLGVAGCVLFEPDDRRVGVPARDQDPSDAVRLDAGEMGADPLRCGRSAKHLGEEVQRLLEMPAFIAPGTKHAEQSWVRAHEPIVTTPLHLTRAHDVATGRTMFHPLGWGYVSVRKHTGGQPMAPPNKTDLRTRILENLLQRVRDDLYPSATMLDMIEAVLRRDEVDEYTDVLFDKVNDQMYPSMDLLRRLHSFV